MRVGTHESKLKGFYLEHERHQNVVFALTLFKFLQVFGKRRVWIYTHDFDVPLVQRVIHQFNL